MLGGALPELSSHSKEAMPQPLPTLDELLHDAARRADLEDFGDPWFRQPLSAWLSDLPHPRLSDAGRQVLIRAAGQELVKRLRVLDTLTSHPEIAEVELPPIILISGYVRSGTTLLHNLMARHPGARALQRWELVRPTPPPRADSYQTDPRIARVQAAQDTLRGTLLERMHWINATDPEECTWGSYDCTGILGRGLSVATPAWSDWIVHHDLTPNFLGYRKLLQLLLWKCPAPPGGHLLLKCPQTAWHIDQFARVFPEARHVILHRDPRRSITSAATLVRANVQPVVDPDTFEWDHLGSSTLEGAAHCYERLLAFDAAPPTHLVHVRYADLMADADAATRQIYRQLDIPHAPVLTDRIRAYLESQRTGHRAAPPPDYRVAGLGAELIEAEPTVGRYIDHFNIQPEAKRLTDTRT
ncbi:MAG: sulfotransferase [Myxococcales bacterium]